MNRLECCDLCPRRCNVDRFKFKGFCSVGAAKIKVGRVSLHKWEEPCVSGSRGSGTIFFAGCNLKCIYCQNYDLSRGKVGKEITIDQLAACMLKLQNDGAHNINLVTPSHYILHIIEAVNIAKAMGLKIPIVYNTSGYETVEAIQALRGTVDVYLTDFKYFDNTLGKLYSGVDDYFEVATEALSQMYNQTEECLYDQDDMIQRGVIVRHLVLPQHIHDSKNVLKFLFERYGNEIVYSIMNQYTPIRKTAFDELNRTVTEAEYSAVVDYALSLGITNAYIQDGETQTESFIPEFNGEGI